MNAKLAPSILSADFSKLGEEIKEVENAGIDWIHVDVMDGHFVPNLTIGPPVVKNLRPLTQSKLDCHLMVQNPEKWIEPFGKAGADLITIHVEVAKDFPRLAQEIRKQGAQVGISLNPPTPVQAVEPFLDLVDLVLVMSVNPGFGGQKFIESSLDKIQKLVHLRGDRKYVIEIDGGVGPQNIKKIKDAGCEVFVAGSAIFSRPNRKEAIDELQSLLN